ncbi:MAG: tetratricopeptide repeat protein, partial [Candidatus Aminicenantes bacterium]|nr:tetratricopeptide repeat protein [Candidatus Aminicenantes bacterium]
DRISGYILAELGRFDQARKAFEGYGEYYRRTYPDRKSNLAARKAHHSGLVDLKQGRLADARARLEELGLVLPTLPESEDREYYTPRYQIMSAEIALSGGSADEAVAAAEKFRPEDFPGMGTAEVSEYNLPMLKDMLARAYWKAGRLDEAAAEYRKLMTIDPSNRIRYLINPLYHYRLGRILEEKGDKSGAAAEYRKFLEYGKDADKIFPEPADARKRLAALEPATR